MERAEAKQRLRSIRPVESLDWGQSEEGQRIWARIEAVRRDDSNVSIQRGVSRSSVLFRVVGAVAAVAFVALTIVQLSNSADEATRSSMVATGAGREPGYIFESLPRLVATSEVVVVGRVESAERAHKIGPPEDDFFVRDVVLKVERQFYGPPVGETVIVDQAGYLGDQSFEYEEQPWVQPGDRVVYFLVDTETRPEGHYTIVAMPGQLLIREDGTVSTPAIDPLARDLDGAAWDTVADQIERAAGVVERRAVEPLPGGPS